MRNLAKVIASALIVAGVVAYVTVVQRSARQGDQRSLAANRPQSALDICQDALWDASAVRPIRVADRDILFPCAGQGAAGPVLPDGSVLGFSLHLSYRRDEGFFLIGSSTTDPSPDMRRRTTDLQGSVSRLDASEALGERVADGSSDRRSVASQDRVQIVETKAAGTAVRIVRADDPAAPPIYITCPAQTAATLTDLIGGHFSAETSPPVLCKLRLRLKRSFSLEFELIGSATFLADAPRSADALMEFLSQYGIHDKEP